MSKQNNNSKQEIDIRPMCHKVVVNENCLSVHPAHACHQYGVFAKIIFERNDGWTLGAPEDLEKLAHSLWDGAWVAFRRFPDYERQTISKYQGPVKAAKSSKKK